MKDSSRYVIYGLISYCLFANLASLFSGFVPLIYVRDAIILGVVFIGLCRYSLIRAMIPCALAIIILLITLVKGIPDSTLLPKIRNYCSLPFLYAAFGISWDIKNKAIRAGSEDKDGWLHFLHGLLCGMIVLEALAYLFIPEAQTLAYGALAALSEEKGVSVGLGGGILNGGRTMTPLLNPVQGSFVLLSILLLIRQRRPFKSFFAVHILTVSKISAGLGLLYSLRKISFRAYLLAGIAVAAAFALILAVVPIETLEVNAASAMLHFEGTVLGVMAPLTDPLGLPFLQVGALSVNDALGVQPGFESFLGSFIAAYGLAGIMVLLVLFIASPRNLASAALLIAWLFSDNISSPHLFIIPAFYVLLNWQE